MPYNTLREWIRTEESYSDDDFEFINFPHNKINVPGVYLIGDNIYVGASKNIYKRIKQHYYKIRFNEATNDNLIYYVSYCLSIGIKIKVTFLAFDVMDEAYYSAKHGVITQKGAKFYHQVYKN